MTMKVKEVADLVGISVRTLHHYDEIGLLNPDTTVSGYRLYSSKDLEILQQILFFKELGFSLKKIKELINRPSFDRQEALEIQRKLLWEKRSRLDKMITTIDKTLRNAKGEIEMSDKEKFAGFDFRHNPYEQEARDRWGDQEVDASNAKLNNMADPEREALADDFTTLYRELATLKHLDPASNEAQTGIKKWYDYLNKIGNYSYAAFKGLGQLYVDDERFTENIDQFGEGLAQFMCEAMRIYADRNK